MIIIIIQFYFAMAKFSIIQNKNRHFEQAYVFVVIDDTFILLGFGDALL